MIKAVKLSNKAPYDLVVEGLENTGPRWQAAGIEEWYFPNGACQGTVSLTAYNNASLSNPSAGIVLITPYYMSDVLPKNAGQSTTIPTQVVQATVSTIQVLQNDGFPAGSQFLEVTPSGAPSSTWSFDNIGNAFIKQYISNVLTTLIQTIAGNNNPIQLLGNLVNWSSTGDYNGQNINLGNRKVIAIKNGAGTLGNVFGVDGSDNTFIQHNSNNQTVIYSSSGVQLLIFDGNGNTIYKNNSYLQSKDSGGTARNVLGVDTNNIVNLDGISGKELINVNKSDGTNKFSLDTSLGIFSAQGTAQLVNGDTSGNMAVNESIGGMIKCCVITQNNYRQAGAKQMISLKAQFTNFCLIINAGCGGIEADSGGASQAIQQITWGTGSSAGTSTGNSQAPTNTACYVNHAVDALGSPGGYASPHTGLTVVIGQ
jgi:hypothetical protein